MGDLVHLNVGGTLYTTTRATLTVYEDSMLGTMFNGTWEISRDAEGRCFVDRDGSLFRHVLNFLRTGELIIPEEFPELKLLRSEADFYQICPLIDAVDSEIQRRQSLKPKQENVRDFYLEVVEITTIYGLYRGSCEKELIICGNSDVIKCLPLDSQIYKEICHLITDAEEFKRVYGSPYENYSVFKNVKYVLNGDSTQIFLNTFIRRAKENTGARAGSFRINRSDLADVLLAKNCSIISSTSEYRDSKSDNPEFHCSDKWRIPEESLNLLSNLPKL